MSGKPNKAWMKTMIKKHGSRQAVKEVMAGIGKKGGSATHPDKGFGSNRELASIAGKKGGEISRRGPNKKIEFFTLPDGQRLGVRKP